MKTMPQTCGPEESRNVWGGGGHHAGWSPIQKQKRKDLAERYWERQKDKNTQTGNSCPLHGGEAQKGEKEV